MDAKSPSAERLILTGSCRPFAALISKIPEKQFLAACKNSLHPSIADLIINHFAERKRPELLPEAIALWTDKTKIAANASAVLNRSIIRYALTFPRNPDASMFIQWVEHNEQQLLAELKETMELAK